MDSKPLQQQCAASIQVDLKEVVYCVREKHHTGVHESDGGRVKWSQKPALFYPKVEVDLERR